MKYIEPSSSDELMIDKDTIWNLFMIMIVLFSIFSFTISEDIKPKNISPADITAEPAPNIAKVSLPDIQKPEALSPVAVKQPIKVANAMSIKPEEAGGLDIKFETDTDMMILIEKRSLTLYCECISDGYIFHYKADIGKDGSLVFKSIDRLPDTPLWELKNPHNLAELKNALTRGRSSLDYFTKAFIVDMIDPKLSQNVDKALDGLTRNHKTGSLLIDRNGDVRYLASNQ